MDFSGLIVLPFAAVITACWIIGAAVLSKNGPGFRAAFLLPYGFGVIFMQPWRIAGWQELGTFAVMLVTLAVYVAVGCVIGGISAALIVFLATKLRQRFRH